MNGKIIVVTGPARSGKSEWAEQLATESMQPVVYVATAQDNPDDPEWQARIQRHQARRPQTWQTVHCPSDLATTVGSSQAHCLLIDSLGTWVTNYLDQGDSEWQILTETLLHALTETQAQTIFVAEETGWGVVPAYPIGRQFRDRLGSLTRAIAARADAVYLVCAGIAVNLKEMGQIIGVSELPG
ncbi:MAG: bifunctional adenosylcobinamide kinase/adenosylcobinamide-phosphate guanylyltransferase [Cyanobacteria bacterium P01_F01_bin.42]